MNTKLERAKSKVVEETKAVFKFGQKIVVNGRLYSNIGLQADATTRA
jgi:hypothetical protein